MNTEQTLEYEQWRSDLITTAIQDFGYAYDVIEPLASAHAYQHHFDNGLTAWEAMQQGL